MGSRVRTAEAESKKQHKMTDLSEESSRESETVFESVARLFYTNPTDLVTVNFYWIVLFTFITVMLLWPLIAGFPRILSEMNSLYAAPPPTGYGVGISGIGSSSRVAYVPQIQDYEYGDLGYAGMDLEPEDLVRAKGKEDLRSGQFEGLKPSDFSHFHQKLVN